MIRQSPSRNRGSDGAVPSVQRDVNESSGGTTQGSRGSDGAVSLVQRNIVVAFRGIKTDNHNFILTPETEKAFEKLKTAFTTTPVLKHFNPELRTRIETDASGYVIGDIMSRLHEGVWHSVAYYSRKQISARPVMILMTRSCYRISPGEE